MIYTQSGLSVLVLELGTEIHITSAYFRIHRGGDHHSTDINLHGNRWIITTESIGFGIPYAVETAYFVLCDINFLRLKHYNTPYYESLLSLSSSFPSDLTTVLFSFS